MRSLISKELCAGRRLLASLITFCISATCHSNVTRSIQQRHGSILPIRLLQAQNYSDVRFQTRGELQYTLALRIPTGAERGLFRHFPFTGSAVGAGCGISADR